METRTVTVPTGVSAVEWVSAASAERPTVVAGLGNRSAQTYFLHRSPSIDDRVVLWLAHDDREAGVTEELLRFWFKETVPVMLFSPKPAPEVLHRLNEKQPLILVTSVGLLETPLPRPEEFRRACLTLTPQAPTSLLGLAKRLSEIGYVAEDKADAPGSFARHGGILDIYAVGTDHPIRLEFTNDRIERILTLKLPSRRTGSTLHNVTVPPAAMPPGAFGNLETYLQTVERLLVVAHDPEESFDEEERIASALRRLRRHPQLIIQTFRTSEACLTQDFHAAPLFHSDFEALTRDLTQRQGTKLGKRRNGAESTPWTVLLYSEKYRELNEKLKAAGVAVKGGTTYPENLEGFENETLRVLCLTDREVFGRRERQVVAQRERLDLGFLLELKAGDFIVHLDHGVGKFLGMTENVVDGVRREYFVLEYAEADRLSVPVENAEKLSKYIGVARPKLHRLSGSSWQQVTKKLKEETKLLARDLLTLYAKRETMKVQPLAKEADGEKVLAASFPYEETEDQMKAIEDVYADLNKRQPMDRLVCGDVGFGKTEVAIRAAYRAVSNGKQVAILSPTTILTQQHEDTFRERLAKLPARIASLSRFQTKEEQRDVVAGLKSGLIDIVIGTHRLLSPDVTFKDLGLIIIDEEQRFGVRHKEQLKRLRTNVHVLTLTATPIPRTLNFALSGIRDISIIETPPEGRLPIETIIEPYAEELVRRAMATELGRKGQVYYLHNDVETIAVAARQIGSMAPKAKVGIAHGQLPDNELASVMAKFDAGKIDILVCSTIIENGLDLPNVNTLIVDNATNFGLASLYQLRGRIGRGQQQAFAYFLYHRRLLTGEAKKRLQALLEARELGSGFQLALRDLEIRGVGNILGKEQHGKIATVGFALYTRLLAQAVEELKTGRPAKQIRDILIDLPLDVGIPRAYVSNESKRLRIYQELANIGRVAELHKKRGDIEKQYDTLPGSAVNLFDLLELKLLSQDTQIADFKTVRVESRERVVIRFTPTIDPKRLPRLLAKNEHWQFTQDSIKIDRERLGQQWLQELKETVKLFAGNGSEEPQKPA